MHGPHNQSCARPSERAGTVQLNGQTRPEMKRCDFYVGKHRFCSHAEVKQRLVFPKGQKLDESQSGALLKRSELRSTFLVGLEYRVSRRKRNRVT